MKPQTTLLSVLLIAVTIFSCSKNNDHPAEGSILKSYTTTFRDSIVFYYIYDRDANNRIISMRDSTWAYEFKTNLVYGSNGKVEKTVFYQQGNIVSSMEFTYNSAGQISKRKVRSGTMAVDENYNVYVYDAAGHLVTDSSYTTANNSTFNLAMVSNFKYTGENITEAEEYLATNGTLALHTRIKYEYDNGVNPFKGMEYEYYFNEAGSAIYTIQLISSNNALKAYTANTSGGWDLQTNSTYQYNSSNFVSKATANNINSTTQKAVTEYFYQK
jgi:hypothetical protein